ELIELQHDQVPVLLVADRETSDLPHRLEGLLELQLLLARSAGRLLVDAGEDVQDRGGEQLHLLLLDEHREHLGSAACLQVKGPVPGLSDGSRGDSIDALELHPAILPPSPGPPSAACAA